VIENGPDHEKENGRGKGGDQDHEKRSVPDRESRDGLGLEKRETGRDHVLVRRKNGKDQYLVKRKNGLVLVKEVGITRLMNLVIEKEDPDQGLRQKDPTDPDHEMSRVSHLSS